MKIGGDSQKDARPGSGRKPKQESRATEFRQRLSAWRQMPVSSRPSLRALACELGTSHQLLTHYLDGLDKWQAKEESRRIRARAKAEDREMTLQEALRAIAFPAILDNLELIKRDAKRGPLNWHQVQMLKIFAHKGVPGAKDLLQEYSQKSPEKRKNNLPAISAGAGKSFRTVQG